jgi:rhodanese-related sulfurtransferase
MEKKIIVSICVIVLMLVSSGMTVNATRIENKVENYMPQKLNDCPINITVQEAYDMLTTTADGIQIPIDVRRDDEWITGFIDTPYPECPRWYTLDLLKTEDGVEAFEDMYNGEEVIIYCKGGYRSLIASLILCYESNFTGTIYNMLGGITAWIDAGYPIRNNTPPAAPGIDGPFTGDPGQKLDYKFSTEDAENDGVYYWVDWNDTSTPEWSGPHEITDIITLNHTWEEKGTYVIKAKAMDFYGNESEVSEYEVAIPRNRARSNLIEWLYDRFPHAISIISYIFGL